MIYIIYGKQRIIKKIKRSIMYHILINNIYWEADVRRRCPPMCFSFSLPTRPSSASAP